MPSINVNHDIQVAHRLSRLPGKCQQIHGHTMNVEIAISGDVNSDGILEGIDFSALKKKFRDYLDTNYDHRLLLNQSDIWTRPVYFTNNAQDAMDLDPAGYEEHLHQQMFLPGLVSCPADPTVENMAKWIFNDMSSMFEGVSYVAITETQTNGATWWRGDHQSISPGQLKPEGLL